MSDFDVYCGRDPKLYRKKKGNLWLKKLVDERLQRYELCHMQGSTLGKSIIIKEILGIISMRGGRFLKQTKSSSGEILTIEVSKKEARNKVSHLLRDHAASPRQHNYDSFPLTPRMKVARGVERNEMPPDLHPMPDWQGASVIHALQKFSRTRDASGCISVPAEVTQNEHHREVSTTNAHKGEMGASSVQQLDLGFCDEDLNISHTLASV